MKKLLWVVLFSGSFSLSLHAAEQNIVEVELLSSVQTVKPGEEFFIGALFQMKPGWHIYWKYPGDAGLPTTLTLHGSSEMKTGELMWPTPEEFLQGKNLIGYGYSQEMFFAIPVNILSQYSGKKVHLNAKLRWLSCDGALCVPGKKELSLNLPVAGKSVFADRERFQELERQIPIPAISDQDLAHVQIKGSLNPSKDPSPFQVTLEWKNTPGAISFLPALFRGLSLEQVAVEEEENITTIQFHAVWKKELKPDPAVFEVVVARSGIDGKQKGTQLRIPLDNS